MTNDHVTWIRILTILGKYETKGVGFHQLLFPIYDAILLNVDPQTVSKEDLEELDKLGCVATHQDGDPCFQVFT